MKFIRDDGTIVYKLTDFGAARELQDDQQVSNSHYQWTPKSFFYTASYLCKEVNCSDPSSSVRGPCLMASALKNRQLHTLSKFGKTYCIVAQLPRAFLLPHCLAKNS
jgi:hypothetical protein